MKVSKYEDREEWLAARRGKITGSKVTDIKPKLRGTGLKKGFYTLIAERLAKPREEGEKPMDRGQRLEVEAIQRFMTETGQEVDQGLYIWSRDEDDSIAVSPDGVIDREHAVEVKCLADETHIETFLTQKIPDEYCDQVNQYFVVNDDLQKVSMIFYDPNLTVKDYFVIEIERDQEKVDEFLEMERDVLARVREVVTELSF